MICHWCLKSTTLDDASFMQGDGEVIYITCAACIESGFASTLESLSKIKLIPKNDGVLRLALNYL